MNTYTVKIKIAIWKYKEVSANSPEEAKNRVLKKFKDKEILEVKEPIQHEKTFWFVYASKPYNSTEEIRALTEEEAIEKFKEKFGNKHIISVGVVPKDEGIGDYGDGWG